MKLILEELQGSGLSQKITAAENISLYAIRPHLYRHNVPSGTLKMQLLTPSDTLLAESETINISAIGSLAFFHGYVRFVFDNYGLKEGTEYKIKLVGTGGYGFSEASYIGWCNGFDLGQYPPTYSPEGFIQYPFDMEIWKRTNV